MIAIKVIADKFKDFNRVCCSRCGSELELNQDEYKDKSLICPCCGGFVFGAYSKNKETIECKFCKDKFTFDPSDSYTGGLGCAYIKCPSCGKELMLGDYGIDRYDKEITVDNLVFPNDFYHTNKNTGAVEIKPDEIKKDIRRMIKSLRETTDRDDWFRYTSSGDTTIAVLKFDGDEEYLVFVAKDAYTTNIPFEECDYH